MRIRCAPAPRPRGGCTGRPEPSEAAGDRPAIAIFSGINFIWEKDVGIVNPVSYQVDALRFLMVQGGQSAFGLGKYCSVLVAALVGFVLLTAWLYPNGAA